MGSKCSFVVIFIPFFMSVAGFSLKDVFTYDNFLAVTKTLGAQPIPLQSGTINMSEVFPDLVHPKCCGNSMPDFSEDDAKIFMNCTKQVGLLNGTAGEIAERINETGRVNLTEFLKYVEKFYGPISMKNATQDFAPNCLECIYTAYGNDMTSNTTCNPEMLQATRCVKYSVLKNCPEDQKNNSTSCELYRAELGGLNTTDY
ncbi:hypothetical protein C0J52_17915 [Blattella germanica]|nr:hypothetical protein C0J52_17915 [Blattella germanica]